MASSSDQDHRTWCPGGAGRGQVWVGFLDDQAAGADPAALIVLVPEPGHRLLENVAVAPWAQGRGAGRFLLGFAEARARELGLPAIRLLTNVAMTGNLAHYARHGYRETGRGAEDGFSRVYFVKEISRGPA